MILTTTNLLRSVVKCLDSNVNHVKLDLFDYMIILLVVILESAMLYVNYIARIRLGAKEMNPIWRKFDLMKGKMRFMSFILMPLLIIGGIMVLFSLPRNIFEDRSIYLASGILIGFLFFNFIADFLTLYNYRVGGLKPLMLFIRKGITILG